MGGTQTTNQARLDCAICRVGVAVRMDGLQDVRLLNNADLCDLYWERMANLGNANIFGWKNSPRDIVEWAIKHGAQRQDTGS